jgi:hypothetical protein
VNQNGHGIAYALPILAPQDVEVIYRRFSDALAQDRVAPDIHGWESTETVFNRPASPRDVRKRLRGLPLRETLEILATIGVEIERGRRPHDAVLQVRVAQRLADDSRRARALVHRLIATPGRILVDEEQIAMASAMAIRYCEGQAWGGTSGMALLEVLLALHSAKGAEVHLSGLDDRAVFRRIEMRATSVDPEKVPDVMARWMAFIEWSKTPTAQSSTNAIDLEQLCRDALGMTYIAWATATWCFTSLFNIIQSAADGSRRYDAFIDPEAAFHNFKDPSAVRHFFGATSIAVDEARHALKNVTTTSLSELEIFMEQPLVITPYGVCCPVLRFLPALAGNALIFRLGSYLDGNGQSSARLRSFWGEFLEYYVFDLIDAATKSQERHLFHEKKYSTPEVKSSDVSLFVGNTAVFIDVTATRFRLRDSVVGLQDKAGEEDLERFIVHKIRDEVARCARDFRSGELQFDGVDPGTLDRIYGLAVSPQNVPRFIGISEALDRQLPNVPEGLAEWDFFDLNEIEFLPVVFPGKLNLADLIATKRADAFGRPRSITNYLYYTDRELFRVKDDPQTRPPDPWFTAIQRQAAEWGLAASSAHHSAGAA